MQDDPGQILKDLGLDNLDDNQKADALDKIFAALEEKVGARAMDQLSDEQLDTFEDFVKKDDPKGATDWLTQQVPGYDQIIKEELDKIKDVVKSGGLAALQNSPSQA